MVLRGRKLLGGLSICTIAALVYWGERLKADIEVQTLQECREHSARQR